MAYNSRLADEIRGILADKNGLVFREKKMFGGLAFLVNDKMCINVSGENLMCRFDPDLQKVISKSPGYRPMIMRGKEMKGYCYIEPEGFKAKKDLHYWIELCLGYNEIAQSSKKKK